MKTYNVNDIARVKLTEKGYSVYNEYVADTHLMNKVDLNSVDKILETELWEIMVIFGNYFYVGSTPVFVDNEISIQE